MSQLTQLRDTYAQAFIKNDRPTKADLVPLFGLGPNTAWELIRDTGTRVATARGNTVPAATIARVAKIVILTWLGRDYIDGIKKSNTETAENWQIAELDGIELKKIGPRAALHKLCTGSDSEDAPPPRRRRTTGWALPLPVPNGEAVSLGAGPHPLQNGWSVYVNPDGTLFLLQPINPYQAGFLLENFPADKTTPA